MKLLKRKIIAVTLLCGMLAAPTPSFAYREYYENGLYMTECTYENDVPSYTLNYPITIHVDGKYIPSDVDPTIRDGRTMVPLRAAGEALGAQVSWDQGTQTATAIKGNRAVQFQLNSQIYYVNGKAQYTDVAPTIINNRALLPLRVFAEALNANVFWDQSLYDVQIDTSETDVAAPNIPIDVPQKTANFIKKYYVQEDSNDPVVGSWRSQYTIHYDDPNITSQTVRYDSYKFITKTGENKYQTVEMEIENDAKYNVDCYLISRNDNTFYLNDDSFFIRGGMRVYSATLPREFPMGTAFYQVNADTMRCTAFYDAFGTPTPDKYNHLKSNPLIKF